MSQANPQISEFLKLVFHDQSGNPVEWRLGETDMFFDSDEIFNITELEDSGSEAISTAGGKSVQLSTVNPAEMRFGLRMVKPITFVKIRKIKDFIKAGFSALARIENGHLNGNETTEEMDKGFLTFQRSSIELGRSWGYKTVRRGSGVVVAQLGADFGPELIIKDAGNGLSLPTGSTTTTTTNNIITASGASVLSTPLVVL